MKYLNDYILLLDNTIHILNYIVSHGTISLYLLEYHLFIEPKIIYYNRATGGGRVTKRNYDKNLLNYYYSIPVIVGEVKG